MSRGRPSGELAAKAELDWGTARFFGEDLGLYRHQEQAIRAAGRGGPVITSTGTGSGKSLTYLVPIVDHVLRHEPERHSVRALVVYPMNALINSQLEALETFRRRYGPDCPVRFARYTGQDRDEARNAIINDPPHILLTNYVMLEYMLIRPAERTLIGLTTRELAFLVMDELHVYRGRQGADVAMLLRRVRQRAGRRDLVCIGTSATIVTDGDRGERRARIAEAGQKLFGVAVPADHVVEETLQRVATVPVPESREALAAAVRAEPPAAERDAVTGHPLAAWVEATFGLAMAGEGLVRRPPLAFEEGLKRLVEATRLDAELCRARLRAVLEAGNAATLPSGEPVFAFRLHQFLASGGSVYTTLEDPDTRTLSTEGSVYAPKTEEGASKLLYPLAFCRECGQEMYLVARVREHGEERLVPRSPLLNAPDDEIPGEALFFTVEHDGLWSEGEDLPDNWYEPRARGAAPQGALPAAPAGARLDAPGRAAQSRQRRGGARGLVAAEATDAVPALSRILRPARDQRLPQARDPQPDRALDRDHHRGHGGGRRPARRPRDRTRSAEGPELHRQPSGRGPPGRTHERLCPGRAAARRPGSGARHAKRAALRRAGQRRLSRRSISTPSCS